MFKPARLVLIVGQHQAYLVVTWIVCEPFLQLSNCTLPVGHQPLETGQGHYRASGRRTIEQLLIGRQCLPFVPRLHLQQRIQGKEIGVVPSPLLQNLHLPPGAIRIPLKQQYGCQPDTRPSVFRIQCYRLFQLFSRFGQIFQATIGEAEHEVGLG